MSEKGVRQPFGSWASADVSAIRDLYAERSRISTERFASPAGRRLANLHTRARRSAETWIAD